MIWSKNLWFISPKLQPTAIQALLVVQMLISWSQSEDPPIPHVWVHGRVVVFDASIDNCNDSLLITQFSQKDFETKIP